MKTAQMTTDKWKGREREVLGVSAVPPHFAVDTRAADAYAHSLVPTGRRASVLSRQSVIGLFVLMVAVGAIACGVCEASPQSEATPTTATTVGEVDATGQPIVEHPRGTLDYWSLLFVFALSTFIGLGVILRVSRLLHTPLMSITNAISAIAVVGSIIVTGGDYPLEIRIMGAVALFCSMTNIVSGFLITDRMLKMFKQTGDKAKK
jgi:NAD(P) transhydrogenase subunit alpha